MKRNLFVVLILAWAALACNANSSGQPNTSATVDAILDTPSPAEGAEIGEVKDPDNNLQVPVSTSTATALPTATATPPERRSAVGEDIFVPICDDGIDFVVDAQDDDWQEQNAPTVVVDNITFGVSRWNGTDDLSGTMQLCWTGEALQMYLTIVDDVHVQTQQGRNQWQGDEVEMVFDTALRDDYFDKDMGADDVQLGISPGDLAGSPISAVRYVPRPFEELDSVAAQTRREIGPGGNYVLELFIPWEEAQIEPQSGDLYGFCLALSDNDQVGQASQDSLVSHCPQLVTNDPTTWVTMALE